MKKSAKRRNKHFTIQRLSFKTLEETDLKDIRKVYGNNKLTLDKVKPNTLEQPNMKAIQEGYNRFGAGPYRPTKQTPKKEEITWKEPVHKFYKRNEAGEIEMFEGKKVVSYVRYGCAKETKASKRRAYQARLAENEIYMARKESRRISKESGDMKPKYSKRRKTLDVLTSYFTFNNPKGIHTKLRNSLSILLKEEKALRGKNRKRALRKKYKKKMYGYNYPASEN
jgi:hypothetical protein